MSQQRNNRRAVEHRRNITLILSEENEAYLKGLGKERKEPVAMVVSRIVNLVLNDMRVQGDG